MTPATIVINAAGCGSRLGMNLPKSLVEVAGQPILHWQLTRLCCNADRVRIVVGYMADDVSRLAKRLLPGIEVLHNRDWKTTKTAASLSQGVSEVPGRVVSLDGDLLVQPDDFQGLLYQTCDTIGITEAKSSEPVKANLDNQGFCDFLDYGLASPFEWTGLVNFRGESVAPSRDHVFQMIDGLLPCQAVNVRCCEVDTPEDLKLANQLWPSFLNNRETKHERCA